MGDVPSSQLSNTECASRKMELDPRQKWSASGTTCIVNFGGGINSSAELPVLPCALPFVRDGFDGRSGTEEGVTTGEEEAAAASAGGRSCSGALAPAPAPDGGTAEPNAALRSLAHRRYLSFLVNWSRSPYNTSTSAPGLFTNS